MAEITKTQTAKLFFAIMYKNKDIFNEILNILIKKFGDIESVLEYDFHFTSYYENETGKNLKKNLIVFKKYIKRDELSNLKIYSNNLEKKYSENKKRKINIDPGYLTLNSLVLASAKNLPHRVYLSKGIYADVVMIYTNKKYSASERAFPDFKQEIVKEFLKIERLKIKEELKSN
jgi:hypothetical protein